MVTSKDELDGGSSQADAVGEDEAEEEAPEELRRSRLHRLLHRIVAKIWAPIERTASPLVAAARRVMDRVPRWAAVAICVLIGLAIGALVAKQRQNAADVAVVVNGEIISGSEYFRRLESTAGTQALDRLIAERALTEYANDRGVTISPADIEGRTRLMTADREFVALMSARHLTTDDARDAARQQLLNEALFGGGTAVSETEIRAFYTRETDPSNPQARLYKAPVLNLDFAAGADATRMRKVWSAIQKGKGLADAAGELGAGPKPVRCGRISAWTPDRAQLRDGTSFDGRVSALSIGEITPPLKYRGEWWIVRCADKMPAQTPPLEQVREQCRAAVRLAKSQGSPDSRARADFDAYRKRVPVRVFQQRYRELQNDQQPGIADTR